MKSFPLSIALCSLTALTAYGSEMQHRVEPGAQHAEAPHETAVTFSPLHLVDPLSGPDRAHLLQVTVEQQLAEDWSAAAILGAGFLRVGAENGILAQLGAQGRYYLIGGFNHGMNLALEASYVAAGASTDTSDTRVHGLTTSALVGYKIAARWGLTFDAQAGAALMGIGATRTDRNTGREESSSLGDVGPVVRLNVGWSF